MHILEAGINMKFIFLNYIAVAVYKMSLKCEEHDSDGVSTQSKLDGCYYLVMCFPLQCIVRFVVVIVYIQTFQHMSEHWVIKA